MARLTSFIQLSLDGCYADASGDMSWAHRDDPEAKAFLAENTAQGGVLLFGRVTYELMVQYWPTDLARKNDPTAAADLNRMPKVVVSRTLTRPSWENTRVARGDAATEVRKLKTESSRDIAVLGSGSLVAALAREDLVDSYQIMWVPIVLGSGKRFFEGVEHRPALTLERTRTFENGNLFVTYRAG